MRAIGKVPGIAHGSSAGPVEVNKISQNAPNVTRQRRASAACIAALRRYSASMFTIEHEFDASVITLIDDEASPDREEITITFFDDMVTLEQIDPHTERLQKITFSMNQISDLRVALDLPEGAYVRRPGGG